MILSRKSRRRGSGQMELLSTQSAAASPVRISASSARARVFLASSRASGENSSASLASYDPASQSWKTSQFSLIEGLATFSGPWPRSGMMRNGTAFRLPTSALPITGTASGLWPTPTARDWKDTPGMKMESRNKDGSIRDRADQLARRVYLEEATPPGGGHLNPMWVEWLQGFPLAWTEV